MSESGKKRGNFFAVLLWAVAFLPALALLVATVQWRARVPYYDSWTFVKQYQDWCEGIYGWQEFLAPHNAHPSAIGKALYFLALHIGHGDVGLLPLVSWTLSLAISLGVLVLSRPLWRGCSARGAGLMFLANLSIFSAIQGHAWIWDFTFQNFIPGACLVIGLLLLGSPHVSWWRWALAALLSLVSAFSFGTGFATGFLLLPAVFMALEQKKTSVRVALTLLGAVWCGAAGWLALNAFGRAGGSSPAADLFARPGACLQYVLAMLGHTLGRGTAMEPVTLCAVWGVVMLMAFSAVGWVLLRRRDAVLLRQSWPWLAFGFWAMLNAAAICIGRFHASLETGMAQRYGTFMLFMPLGTMMLVATLGTVAATGWWKKLAPVALGVLLVAQSLSWNAGLQGMELFHQKMISRKASLDFINALPPLPSVFWRLELSPDTLRGARYLAENGRLHDVVPFRDAAIESYPVNPEISSKWANWRLVSSALDSQEMRGTCGLSKQLSGMADLVLITATPVGGPEKIIALVPPEPPEDFFEHAARRREFHEHYFGWRWPVDRSLLPSGKDVTLRAYAYDESKRKVRLIPGEAVLAARQP